MPHSGWSETVPTDAKTMFHGTEAGAALDRIKNGYRSIAGPGTHKVRKHSWAGARAMPTVAQAVQRANVTRHFDEFGKPTRLSTPVVLEVQPSCLRKVPGSPCHNVLGQVGQPVEGMSFLVTQWMEQVRNKYLELEKPTVR